MQDKLKLIQDLKDSAATLNNLIEIANDDYPDLVVLIKDNNDNLILSNDTYEGLKLEIW